MLGWICHAKLTPYPSYRAAVFLGVTYRRAEEWERRANYLEQDLAYQEFLRTQVPPPAEDPRPHAWSIFAACFCSCLSPIQIQPTRAVTAPNHRVSHRVTYPYPPPSLNPSRSMLESGRRHVVCVAGSARAALSCVDACERETS